MPRLPAGVYLRRPGYRVLSALVLAVIVGGIIVVARLFGSVAADQRSPQPNDRPAPTAVRTTQGDDSVYSPTTRAPDGAEQVGDAFVRAWLQPTDGRSQKQWFAGLERYAQPDLANQLKDVDPTTNPATSITGDSTATPLSDTAVRVETPTNAGPATTLCVLTADGWRVATIDLGE
ncbi:hypothetical protein [Cryptosporangium phraense]|uniref:Uncharacterized protein n=1 Tax=Cryptosporangium phraense TaxID=2593070 RepID=A0A545AK68_9ACTN|nr:hypothetical protein [Cryptosporangium phraense]TQS41650.1 hypothetical protein FL583_28765 [Cryptosporangium phraense]